MNTPSALRRQSAVPADLSEAVEEAWARVRRAPGFLSEREARFLALVAAATPAQGVILEIGSFKGKSTVGLASIALRYGFEPVVAVDPHTAPSVTDPKLAGQSSTWVDFLATLRAAGVTSGVEAHRLFSRDLAPGWNRPIRLLWIDGDHTYAGTKEDFDLFRRHLAPGGVVALHDALHPYEGPTRVFVQDILPSDDFGPAGICGSIAWAQYRPNAGARWRASRRRLARKGGRLLPFVRGGKASRGFAKLRYKFWRWLVPHGEVKAQEWIKSVRSAL